MQTRAFAVIVLSLALVVGARAQEDEISILEDCHHGFVSVLSKPIQFTVKTTSETRAKRVEYGETVCVFGDLIAIQIRFHSGKTLQYTARDLRMIRARSHADTEESSGGWLIGRHGLEYVSNPKYQQTRADANKT